MVGKTSNLRKEELYMKSSFLTTLCERNYLNAPKCLVNYFDIRRIDIEPMWYFKDVVSENRPSATKSLHYIHRFTSKKM